MRGLLVVWVLVAAAPAAAQDTPSPFDQGRISVGLSLGSQDAFGDRYVAVGGRFGYYVAPGLELAASGLGLFGGEPGVAMVSPELRYVLVPLGSAIKPFVGAFYRHWFVGDPFDDYDTVGGTLGALWWQGRGVVFGLGLTYERVVSSCDESAGDDCSFIYPSLILALSF